MSDDKIDQAHALAKQKKLEHEERLAAQQAKDKGRRSGLLASMIKRGAAVGGALGRQVGGSVAAGVRGGGAVVNAGAGAVGSAASGLTHFLLNPRARLADAKKPATKPQPPGQSQLRRP